MVRLMLFHRVWFHMVGNKSMVLDIFGGSLVLQFGQFIEVLGLVFGWLSPFGEEIVDKCLHSKKYLRMAELFIISKTHGRDSLWINNPTARYREYTVRLLLGSG